MSDPRPNEKNGAYQSHFSPIAFVCIGHERLQHEKTGKYCRRESNFRVRLFMFVAYSVPK
jgi:hypothetical protein